MAEICKQCAITHGLDDDNLAGLCDKDETALTHCDLCGGMVVNYQGKCVDEHCPTHGKEGK